MNFHGAGSSTVVVLTVVNENREFRWANFVCSKAKNKQHGVDYVWLSTAVRSNNWRKTLQIIYACLLFWSVNNLKVSCTPKFELNAPQIILTHSKNNIYFVKWTQDRFPRIRFEVDVDNVGDNQTGVSLIPHPKHLR